MENILFSVTPAGVSATFTVMAFRLDGFTDEATSIQWVADALANINDQTHKVQNSDFKQVPKGPAKFSYRQIGAEPVGDIDCIWTNNPADVALWIRTPGTLLSSFAGIRKTLEIGTGVWVNSIESTWRYAAIAVRLTDVGLGGTFAIDVRSLADPERPASAWKLAPVGLYQ